MPRRFTQTLTHEILKGLQAGKKIGSISEDYEIWHTQTKWKLQQSATLT
jgi:hypothetical protein